MKSEFENRSAARIVGVKPRTLIDWSERGIVSPDIQEAAGVGSRRQYSELNLVELAIASTLLSDGVKREIVKAVIAFGRTKPAERRDFFSLSRHLEEEGELYLIIDLSTPAWTFAFHRTQHASFSKDKAALTQWDNLARLGERVRNAGRAYVLNLGDLKRQLRKKLEQ